MRRLTTRAWLLRHIMMIVLVAGFLALGWWQIRRAAEGNMLSFGYAIEWPVFAGFVVLIWARELRSALHGSTVTERRAVNGRVVNGSAVNGRAVNGRAVNGRVINAVAEPEIPGVTKFDLDAALAARADRDRTDDGLTDDRLSDYNQYLTWLAANPEAKPSDYWRHGLATKSA